MWAHPPPFGPTLSEGFLFHSEHGQASQSGEFEQSRVLVCNTLKCATLPWLVYPCTQHVFVDGLSLALKVFPIYLMILLLMKSSMGYFTKAVPGVIVHNFLFLHLFPADSQDPGDCSVVKYLEVFFRIWLPTKAYSGDQRCRSSA